MNETGWARKESEVRAMGRCCCWCRDEMVGWSVGGSVVVTLDLPPRIKVRAATRGLWE